MTRSTAYNSIPYSSTRNDRTLEALVPEIIGIDQRHLSALLAEIISIAKEIPFMDETAQGMDTWQNFLEEDVLFFLVHIQQYPIQRPKRLTIEASRLYLLELIAVIDRWYKKANKLQLTEIVFELENAIHHQLSKCISTSDKKTITTLHKIWYDQIVDTKKHEKIPVEKGIEMISNTIRFLQRISKEIFETYATTSHITKPHTALIVTFLKLYGHVQNQYNEITKKHLNYYYEDILKQTRKEKIPERTQVFFELTKESQNTVIEDGTLLIGGMEEDGTEILFKTLGALSVSKAILTDLITLYVASNPCIEPHNKATMITGIYQNNLQDALQLDPTNTPYQLFGQDGFGTNKATNIEHSNIGWAISAPIFMLKEGVRKVSITITIDQESTLKIQKQLRKLVQLTQVEEHIWIHRFFSKAFQMSITTQNGWYSIPQFFSTIKEQNKTYQVCLSFSLAIDVPAIVSYHQDLHGGTYATSWPILKIVLHKDHIYYPYSFLRTVKINTIHTQVEVQDLKGVSVYDDYGQQDISKPFYLFGMQPGQAAACYIGHDEWKYKKLTKVAFDIEWHHISNLNFAALYKSYPEKITAKSFRIAINTLSSRTWKTAEKSESEWLLFNKEGNALATNTSIKIDTPALLKTVPDFEHEELHSLENAKNGYFRWQITAPSFGFGHEVYPILVNEKVMEITRDPKKARKNKLQLPQPPFSPQVQKLKVHYTAEQEFILHAADGKRYDKRYPFQVFHIHPFGSISVATQEEVKSRELLPSFEDRGYLYIGLANATPQEELSLYLHLESPHATSNDSSSIRWEYLESTNWKEVSSTFLLFDGTDAFQHSGSIRIRLPRQLKHHHPLFDSEKTWLRLSIPSVLHKRVGKIICMQLNGIQVVRVPSANKKEYTAITEANVVTRSYTPIPTVKNIKQPFIPNRSDRAENEIDFYTRVSERLFHKKRAVVPSDFELLILEAFPQVYQVSCFPSTLYPKAVPPGTLQIMVLPFIYKNTPMADRLFNSYTLQKIKAYIQELSIHHKVLKITNPFYETIRVSCKIVFNEGFDTGMALQELIETINQFIAPWILRRTPNTKEQSPQEPQVLHPSSLMNYIATLSSVQYIGGISLTQIHEFEDEREFVFREAIGTDAKIGLSPTKPWSVFVPSTQHAIEILSKPKDLKMQPLGIGSMEIENDFILKKNKKHENTDPKESR